MRLLLIRHGQTPSNVAGVICSAFPGPGLTTLGHAQARELPRALAHEKVVGLYATPLVRTQLTAAPLAEERRLDVTILDGLKEIEAGDLEGATDKEGRTAYIDTMFAWASGNFGRPMPGGPNGYDFMGRFDAALRAIAQAHGLSDTVAIISHGAAIRVWSAARASDEPAVAVEKRLLNTGLVIVEGDPEAGWNLVHWREEPLGGVSLEGNVAHDVTGGTRADAAS